jgi:hypothetical protein
MFLKRTPEKDAPKISKLEEYLSFTASPTRDRAKRTEDFEEIHRIPGLIRFGTNGRNILIAETEIIIITDETTGFEHEIGSFLIYVIREQEINTRDGKEYKDRHWTVDFRFKNLTGKVQDCMHPHIKTSPYMNIPTETGYLCIRHGQHSVFQAIREARIPDALLLLIKILYMYQNNSATNRPFSLISSWPLVGAKP